MRGDSLRDLYAKVLAILGLGALAGVGALVDYWPVSVTTPPIVARGTIRPELPTLVPASRIPVPEAPQVTIVRRELASAPTLVASVSAPGAVPSIGSLPIGEVLDLNALPPFAPPQVPADVATGAPAEPVDLSAPPMPIETLVANSHQPRLVLATEGESGFLMGTLRKTGAGLVGIGAATGASIADAFRGVFGAFKKVRPFKDRAMGAMN